jgi:hypothetical protein
MPLQQYLSTLTPRLRLLAGHATDPARLAAFRAALVTAATAALLPPDHHSPNHRP